MTDRLAYRVPEVCAMLGISRDTFYKRVKAGDIPIVKLGRVSLVTRASLERLLETSNKEPHDATPGLAVDAERRPATD